MDRAGIGTRDFREAAGQHLTVDGELYPLPRGLEAVLDQFGTGGESQCEVVLADRMIMSLTGDAWLHRKALL